MTRKKMNMTELLEMINEALEQDGSRLLKINIKNHSVIRCTKKELGGEENEKREI